MTFNDILFIISMCVIPALIYVIISGIRVNSTFKKYSNVNVKSGLTGAQVAKMILDRQGISNVSIASCPGSLTDHYDPRSNTVFLSDATYNSSSVSALGVAAHEVGHAIQYAKNYAPLKLRAILVPLISFTSKFSMPLILISIVLELFLGFGNPISNIMLAFSIGFYACYMIFTLITLPVEYNASRRAKKLLVECGAVDSEEVALSAKVLSAAAQTYLASFVYSFVQLCRMLLILLSRRNRR